MSDQTTADVLEDAADISEPRAWPFSIEAVTYVHVTAKWQHSGGPRFKPWHGAKREAEWFFIHAEAKLPLVGDDVRVEGRGHYLKNDGVPGRQLAELSFGRLDAMPPELADLLWKALQNEAESAS